MKKILIITALALLSGLQAYSAIIATNIVGSSGSVYLLTTNRASVQSIQLYSATATGSTVRFYDSDSLADPYYGTNYVVSGSYITKSTYPTNYVTSFVGYNGYTNWYTNAGIWTLSTTNTASTNALSPLNVYIAPANAIAVYDADLIFTRGISAMITTNVNVVITYKSGQ